MLLINFKLIEQIEIGLRKKYQFLKDLIYSYNIRNRSRKVGNINNYSLQILIIDLRKIHKVIRLLSLKALVIQILSYYSSRRIDNHSRALIE